MKISSVKIAAALTAAVLSASLLTACGKTEGTSEGFSPRLDTEQAESIDVAGFFGNYEAFDSVVNSFNEIYPNVTVNYEQAGANHLSEYTQNNSYIDIFMTCKDNISSAAQPELYVNEYCADLSAEDINVSAVTPEMQKAFTVDGKLLSLPASQKIYGMAVNKTLLENEGLSVPQTYSEFIDVLKALKDKGYTPIQGSSAIIYSCLGANMAANIIGNDADMQAALESGDASAVQKITPVFTRLKELLDNGYTDHELNCTYPDDNYDQAILNFFEGNVPFWACNSENVSGMKKRESKSETFSASPFEYEFIYVPMGDNGVYDYREAWYGFSLNKNSDNYDYALEFLRFIAQEDNLNTLASIKGVPTVTGDPSNEVFSSAENAEKVESAYINDGAVNSYMLTLVNSAGTGLANGTYSTVEEAAEYYVGKYSGTLE